MIDSCVLKLAKILTSLHDFKSILLSVTTHAPQPECTHVLAHTFELLVGIFKGQINKLIHRNDCNRFWGKKSKFYWERVKGPRAGEKSFA